MICSSLKKKRNEQHTKNKHTEPNDKYQTMGYWVRVRGKSRVSATFHGTEGGLNERRRLCCSPHSMHSQGEEEGQVKKKGRKLATTLHVPFSELWAVC